MLIRLGSEAVLVREPSVTGETAVAEKCPTLTPSDRKPWPSAADGSVFRSWFSSDRQMASPGLDRDLRS